MNNTKRTPSPCLGCRKVSDPRACEDKQCPDWQKWFLQRWSLIHSYHRRQMENAQLKPVGVTIGGKPYAAPHQVSKYLHTDPCTACLCPKELCSEPCRVRRAWDEARQEAFL